MLAFHPRDRLRASLPGSAEARGSGARAGSPTASAPTCPELLVRGGGSQRDRHERDDEHDPTESRAHPDLLNPRRATHTHVVPQPGPRSRHLEGVLPRFPRSREARPGDARRGAGSAPGAQPYASRRMSDETLRIIPLGGLGEVGKNMTVFETGGETIVIDAGLAFPRDEHLGVDLVLPDFGYLQGREVLAVVLTHAHEDHVGALPYLLREIRVQVRARNEAHARARQVEARRAWPSERRRAARGRARLGHDRARAVPSRARPHGAFGARRGRHLHRDAAPAGSSTPATGSSTTRRSTGSAPTSASSRRSGTAASTCCSATRRMPSSPVSRAPSGSSARRSARSSPPGRAASSSRRSRRTSTGCSRRSTSRSRSGGR